MALHTEITGALGMPVFFCQKASPWQRPSNENTNGLLRGVLPQGRRPARVQRRGPGRGGGRAQRATT
jgi:IS30 family transposase